MVWAWEVGKDPQVILMCRHVWEPLLHVASTIISLNKTHLALSPVLKDLPNLLDQQIKWRQIETQISLGFQGCVCIQPFAFARVRIEALDGRGEWAEFG